MTEVSNVDNSKSITHVSLCTGYGGIDLGLRRSLPNLKTICYVERDAFAIANLVGKIEEDKMDAAPIWSDLRTFPSEQFRDRVDIISGGYPCQPFSKAGSRKGEEDPRHLWPYVKRAVATIHPRLCFFENVEGHITLGLKDVLHDLGELGYECAAGTFSAEECGAPHGRKRLFILAHAYRSGRIEDCFNGKLRADRIKQPPEDRWPSRPSEAQKEWESPRVLADTNSSRRHKQTKGRDKERDRIENCSEKLADPQMHDRRDLRQRGEARRSEQHSGRDSEPRVGGGSHGNTERVDPALNRLDRLRLLGNGVIPAQCDKAFRYLVRELQNAAQSI